MAMDESLFHSLPDATAPVYSAQMRHHLKYLMSSPEKVKTFLCYECGEIIPSVEYQGHLLAHELIGVAYQLYSFEVGEEEKAKEMREQIKKKEFEEMKAKVLKLEAEYLKKYLPDDNIEVFERTMSEFNKAVDDALAEKKRENRKIEEKKLSRAERRRHSHPHSSPRGGTRSQRRVASFPLQTMSIVKSLFKHGDHRRSAEFHRCVAMDI